MNEILFIPESSSCEFAEKGAALRTDLGAALVSRQRILFGQESSHSESAPHYHGFVEKHGKFTTVDHPNARQTLIYGNNSRGDIAGTWVDSTGAQHGFAVLPHSGIGQKRNSVPAIALTGEGRGPGPTENSITRGIIGHPLSEHTTSCQYQRGPK